MLAVTTAGGKKLKTLGLYIHIPFCLSKCRYCDFCSFPHPKAENVKKYIDALFCEIEEYGKACSEYTVNTVYFGGGTPTLLEADTLSALLEKAKKTFRVTSDAEISVECNPATADLQYFQKLRFCGFNRLSIGVQSMNDSELKLLGRLHKAEDAKKSFADARLAGFDNISVDVMFGIPDQTKRSLKSTLTTLCELFPDHISLYGLKIEEGTHFAKHLSELKLPNEDDEYEMYIESSKFLAAMGYEKYEISNFAKDGRYSRHNLKYWQREDYLGLGLAAHSCMGNRRFSNTRDILKYLRGERLDTDGIISKHDILCEKIMLGMRLCDGVDFDILGKDADGYRKKLEKFISSGHVKKDGGSLAFNDSGMYISNYVLSEVLDFED